MFKLDVCNPGSPISEADGTVSGLLSTLSVSSGRQLGD